MKRIFYFDRTDQSLCPETILWLEGDGNYTRIYREQEPASIMAYTLKRFEKRFDCFVRIRRNVLVNPLHIHALRQGKARRLTICLTDGTMLSASRRKGFKLMTVLNSVRRPR